MFHFATEPAVHDLHREAAESRRRGTVGAADMVLGSVPLLVSLSSVYSGIPFGRPSRESDHLHHHAPYARSKLAVEPLSRRRVAMGGSATLCRPFADVSENQWSDMATSIWIRAAEYGQPLALHSTSPGSQDLTDVRGIADSLIVLAQRRVAGTVNIRTGVDYGSREVVTGIAVAMSRKVRIVLERADHDDPSATLADTARSVAATGRCPGTDLDDVPRRQVAGAIPSTAAVHEKLA